MARLAWCALALFALASPLTEARAEDTKRACIDANESAQIAQRAGRLREAREHLIFCARDACPGAVRSDCARLLTELLQVQPTVVVDAHDTSGAETTKVRMYLDGVRVADALTGLEVELDPGPHTVRFELADGGRSKELQIVVKEGEKRRRLIADFSEPKAEGPLKTSPAPAQPAHARSPLAPWIFGGVAAVAAASYGVLAGLGYAREKDLASSCAPHCSAGAIASVRRDYIVADVWLGIAVVSLGVAIVLAWIGRDGAQPARAAGW
jgi:hypothetical protein